MYTVTQDIPCPTCRTGLAMGGAAQCSACSAAGVPLPAPAAPTPAPFVPELTPSLVPLLAAVERVFRTMRRRHPDLPHVVVAIGPSSGTRAGEVLGWHAPNRWQGAERTYGEILISAEGLALGAEELLNTCLHEGAHALAGARKIRDTSDAGTYHNRAFAKLAGELGLAAPEASAPRTGFSACTLTDATKTLYAANLIELGQANTMHRSAEHGRGKGAGGAASTAKPKRVKAVCQCAEPRAFYIAPGVLELCPIVCHGCRAAFEAEA